MTEISSSILFNDSIYLSRSCSASSLVSKIRTETMHTAKWSVTYSAGWPEKGFFEASPSSYCGVGLGASSGREFSEAHFRACLHADLCMTGRL